MSTTDSDVTETDSRQPRVRSSRALQVIAGAVVVIGIGTSVIGYSVTRNQDRLAGCVVGYSNSLADALERRTSASAEAFEKLDVVMRTVVDSFSAPNDTNSQAVRQAILDYVHARDTSKQAQKDNPLPEAPRDACAELLD